VGAVVGVIAWHWRTPSYIYILRPGAQEVQSSECQGWLWAFFRVIRGLHVDRGDVLADFSSFKAQDPDPLLVRPL
jgi:hypothetical protein